MLTRRALQLQHDPAADADDRRGVQGVSRARARQEWPDRGEYLRWLAAGGMTVRSVARRVAHDPDIRLRLAVREGDGEVSCS